MEVNPGSLNPTNGPREEPTEPHRSPLFSEYCTLYVGSKSLKNVHPTPEVPTVTVITADLHSLCNGPHFTCALLPDPDNRRGDAFTVHVREGDYRQFGPRLLSARSSPMGLLHVSGTARCHDGHLGDTDKQPSGLDVFPHVYPPAVLRRRRIVAR